jgi:hypothetical protein
MSKAEELAIKLEGLEAEGIGGKYFSLIAAELRRLAEVERDRDALARHCEKLEADNAALRGKLSAAPEPAQAKSSERADYLRLPPCWVNQDDWISLVGGPVIGKLFPAGRRHIKEVEEPAQAEQPRDEPVAQQEPVLFVSPEQLNGFKDPEEGDFVDASTKPFGRYIPARKTTGGKFTQPLFTSPQVQQPISDEQKRELVGNWFAEGWAINAALGMLGDYETINKIGG